MQISARVRVTNNRLNQIASALPGAADYATELAADAIVTRARQLVPVRTGALKASITKAGGGGDWIVTATAAYAGYVEFGTRYMAAQPYLRPALEGLSWGGIISAFFSRLGL
jgi:HK97 gp10 family phage protein